MATGQTLLDTMEMLDQELQLQASETDVVRGLIALNRAQDYFETLAAQHPRFKGDTTGTVATVNDTESTAFPTGVLRIDELYMLDSSNRPEYELDNRDEEGGHAPSSGWPLVLYSTFSAGKPRAFYTDGRNIYWDPRPNGAYTVRWYGFQVATDITAGGTFLYDDIVILPLASFAVKLMRLGVGDDVADIDTLAATTFGPVLKTLSGFNRSKAARPHYTEYHST